MGKFSQIVFWGMCALAPAMVPVMAGEAGQAASQLRTILVFGGASVDAPPDYAAMELTVQTQGKTVAAATGENARKMSAVIKALRGMGLAKKQMETESFTVSPQYVRGKGNYSSDTLRPVAGYKVRNSLHVDGIAPDKVARVLDLAVRAGANRVGDVSYQLKDYDRRSRHVFALAVQDAEKKASEMARAAHARLGPALQITEPAAARLRDPSVMQREVNYQLALSPGGSEPPIQPRNVSISHEVVVKYALQ